MTASDVIGIDASRLTRTPRTGTETYTFELLSALARLAPPVAIELYLNASAPPADLPLVGQAVCMPFPRFWTHFRLSAAMARRRPGVLFVPAHVIPIVHPPTVVTIHDVGYLHVPDAHRSRDRRRLDWTTRWSVRAAARVIAISETTKADLVAAYTVDPSRVVVIPHGVGAAFHPATPEEIARVRDRHGLNAPYLLGVGTIQPRKNLGRQAIAMNRVKSAGLPHELVLAGNRGWMPGEVEREIAESGAAERVRILGYVDDRDLPALYSGAELLSFPSLYEGFGLPMLEAMACGLPVVASASSSLPEVAGDAAILVDPTSADAIGSAYLRILQDPVLAADLSRRGAERAKLFPWDRTAAETLAVLREVRDGA